MPTDSEIEAAVRKSLNDRNENATAEEFGTLVRLVKGYLRTALSNPPLDPVAQKLTDLFLAGRQNVPGGWNRPQLRSLVGLAFAVFGLSSPSSVVTETVVNVVIGWEIDQSTPTLPGAGQTVLVQRFVGMYLAAA